MSCPICSEDSQPAFRPFCSKRCADIDLGRWMTGAYSVPSEEVAEGGEFAEFEAHKSFDKQN